MAPLHACILTSEDLRGMLGVDIHRYIDLHKLKSGGKAHSERLGSLLLSLRHYARHDEWYDEWHDEWLDEWYDEWLYPW